MIRADVTATSGTQRVTLSFHDVIREGPGSTTSVTVFVVDNTLYPVGTEFALVPLPKGTEERIVQRWIAERLR